VTPLCVTAFGVADGIAPEATPHRLERVERNLPLPVSRRALKKHLDQS
jgi:hypothetical protein